MKPAHDWAFHLRCVLEADEHDEDVGAPFVDACVLHSLTVGRRPLEWLDVGTNLPRDLLCLARAEARAA